MASQPRYCLLALLLVAASSAVAACCHRKGNAGCCGKGPCNIFCCNCDNGCNQYCESHTCNTGEWAICLAGKTGAACARSCGREPGSDCSDCQADAQEGAAEDCKKCYEFSRRKLMSMSLSPQPSGPAHQNCLKKLTECESQCVLGMDTCEQCFGDSYDTCRTELRPGDELLAWAKTLNATGLLA